MSSGSLLEICLAGFVDILLLTKLQILQLFIWPLFEGSQVVSFSGHVFVYYRE